MRRLLASVALGLSVGCGSGNPTTPTSGNTTQPATGSYTLSGTVRSPDGVPLVGATVFVGHDPRYPGTGSGQTGAQGHYVISGLLAGTWDVFASKPGYVTVNDTVVIAVGAVKDFTLRPGVSVGGRTSESGVGPLGSVSVTVTSGPDAGTTTTSTSWGTWSMGPLTPGDFTVRASKAGYESIDQAIHAPVDTFGVDFTMKWAYGTCLTSVTPVLFDRFASDGGSGSIAVVAAPGRSWTAVPDSPWISVAAGAAGTGPGTVSFRVQPNPIGAFGVRQGAVMIRCSASEGQNVWINQLANCQLSVGDPTPAIFPASGGTGRIPVQRGVGGCQWTDASEATWITLVGASSYMTGETDFMVAANTTGAVRTGTIVIGEIRRDIVQQP